MNRIADFLALYRLYRAVHPRIYAAKIAYGVVFRNLPF